MQAQALLIFWYRICRLWCELYNHNNIGNMMKMIVTESIGAIVFSAQLHPNGQAQAILREVSDTHPTTGNW